MRLAKSAKLPNGKAYESVMDLCKDLMHRPIKVTLEHREWNGQQQENVKYVNASEYPDCKHVFKEKKQVTTDTVAAPPNESFAADMPKQPENLSLGNLDDFEEIVSDGVSSVLRRTNVRIYTGRVKKTKKLGLLEGRA